MSVGSSVDLIDDLEFIKGDKIVVGDSASKLPGEKRVLVVEFWATWCPPCRTSIPHLTEIQQRYKDKDVYLVGVTNETNKKQIESFVSGMGPKMDYTVAIDRHRSAHEALMVPSGARGIPHAFIIDWNDKVVYEGHPMEPAFEQTLAKLAAQATPRVKPKELPPITESEGELMKKSVKELKGILQERGVYFGDCVEKVDLARRIVERCGKAA